MLLLLLAAGSAATSPHSAAWERNPFVPAPEGRPSGDHPNQPPLPAADPQQLHSSRRVAPEPAARAAEKARARTDESDESDLSTVLAVVAALGGLAAVAAVYYYRRQAIAGERQAGVATSQAQAARELGVPRVQVQQAPVGSDWRRRFVPHAPFRMKLTVRHVQGAPAQGVVVTIDRFEVFGREQKLLFSRDGDLTLGLMSVGEVRVVEVPLLPSPGERFGEPYDLAIRGHVQLANGGSLPFAFRVNPKDRFAGELVPILPD